MFSSDWMKQQVCANVLTTFTLFSAFRCFDNWDLLTLEGLPFLRLANFLREQKILLSLPFKYKWTNPEPIPNTSFIWLSHSRPLTSYSNCPRTNHQTMRNSSYAQEVLKLWPSLWKPLTLPSFFLHKETTRKTLVHISPLSFSLLTVVVLHVVSYGLTHLIN